MRRLTRRIMGAGLAAAVTLLLPASSAAQARYTLQRLTPPGAISSSGRSLDESGQVLGTANYANGTSPGFLHSAGPLGTSAPPSAILLPPGFATCSIPYHLGNGGHALLSCYNAAANAFAEFLYFNGTFNDLTAAGFSPRGAPNRAGAIAGAVSPTYSAAIYQNGAVTVVGDGTFYDAVYMNDAGDVVGGWPSTWLYRAGSVFSAPFSRWGTISDDLEGPLNASGLTVGNYLAETGQERLGYWSNGALLDIGYALPSGHVLNDPRGMNARNDVFGNAYSLAPQQLEHGFVYSFNGAVLRDVGSLGGNTCLHGINDQGDAVGHSGGPGNRNYSNHPAGMSVVYTGGRLHDLNGLIPPGSGLVLAGYSGAINNRGQILVECHDSGGAMHACLLTPLPVTTSRLGGLLRADGWFRGNVTVTLTGSDPVYGVSEIHYRVDNGTEVVYRPASPSATATTSMVVSQVGTHLVTHWSVDAMGRAAPAETTTVSIDRGSLVISTTALPDATRGAAYSAALTAIQGSAPYTWRAVTTPPCGLSLSSAGLLSGTPTCEGTHSFMVQVTGRNLATVRSYLTVNIYAPLVNAVPDVLSITYTPNNHAPLLATGGAPPYRWSVSPQTPLPATMAIDNSTLLGAFNEAGSQPLTLTVTDSRGVSATSAVTLNVVGDVVIYGDPSPRVFLAGQPIQILLSVGGGVGEPYTWSFDPAYYPPPVPGLSIDPATGLISGSIVAPGNYSIFVYAADAAGNRSPTWSQGIQVL